MADPAMDGLVAFLKARLDEDARIAQQADWGTRQHSEAFVTSVSSPGIAPLFGLSPSRALAEIEAKRRIIEQFTMIHLPTEWTDAGPAVGAYVKMQWVLKYLALPYADHPEYREEWKP
jgi:hypothetical protein